MKLAFPILLTFRPCEGALRERANQRFLSIFVSIFLPLMVFLAHNSVFDKDPDIILDNVVVDTMIQNQVSNVVKPIKMQTLRLYKKTFYERTYVVASTSNKMAPLVNKFLNSKTE